MRCCLKCDFGEEQTMIVPKMVESWMKLLWNEPEISIWGGFEKNAMNIFWNVCSRIWIELDGWKSGNLKNWKQMRIEVIRRTVMRYAVVITMEIGKEERAFSEIDVEEYGLSWMDGKVGGLQSWKLKTNENLSDKKELFEIWGAAWNVNWEECKEGFLKL